MHRWLNADPKSFQGIGERLMQIAAILVLLLSIKRDLSLDLHSARHPLPYDFRAIYCGEFVTAHNGDPYLAQALRRCEVSITNPHLANELQKTLPIPNQALPATFPPFALTAFAPLGYLSEPMAQRIFYTLSFAALLATIWAVSKIVNLPLALITIVFTTGMYTASSVVGAIAAFSTFGVAFTTLCYMRKQYFAAAAACMLTMLEPQTGIAIFAVLFLKDKGMRLPLIGIAAILGVLSLPFHGLERLHEYPQMLAIHSRAEEYEIYQLSLTYVAHLFGTPERLSASLGTLAYASYVVIAFFYVRREPRNGALVVAMPAALSVLPGSFVHSVYLANMFIAALIFIQRYRSTAALFGLACIATAWQPILKPSYNLYLFGSTFAFTTVALYMFHQGMQRWVAPLWALAALGYCKFCVRAAPLERTIAPSIVPAHYASEEWYRFLSMQDAPDASVWFLKLPFFLGMACIMFAARPRPAYSPDLAEIETYKDDFITTVGTTPSARIINI